MCVGNGDNSWIGVECVECDDGVRSRWRNGVGGNRNDVWLMDEECVIWDEWVVVRCDGWANTSIFIVT